MLNSKWKRMVNITLIAVTIFACLVILASRPADAAVTVLRIQPTSSFSGEYATTKTVYFANDLKTLHFRCYTSCPGAVKALLVVSNEGNVQAGLIGSTQVTLNFQGNQTHTFYFDLAQLLKKYKNGAVPKGRYYIKVYLQGHINISTTS